MRTVTTAVMARAKTAQAGSVLAAAVAVAMGIVLLAAARAPISATAPIEPPAPWDLLLPAALVAAFVCWAVAITLSWASRLTARVALAGAAVIQILPLAGPVMFSQDASAYERYAQVAGNPYTADIAPRLVYGPLFTGLIELGERVGVGVTTYRVVACLAWLAVTALVWRITRNPTAVVIVGWSPQLALDFAGAGHNDALMVLLMVASIALAQSRPLTGGALWAAGAAIKWIPLVLLPQRLLLDRHQRRFLAGLTLALLALAAAATARYGTGWLASSPIFNQIDAPTRNSLPHVLGLTGIPQRAATLLTGLAFLTVWAILLRRTVRDGRPRMSLTLAALVITMPWLMGWYIAWGLPLAALENDRRAAGAWIGIAAYFLAWGLLS